LRKTDGVLKVAAVNDDGHRGGKRKVKKSVETLRRGKKRPSK
jgi:hypothetical protein